MRRETIQIKDLPADTMQALLIGRGRQELASVQFTTSSRRHLTVEGRTRAPKEESPLLQFRRAAFLGRNPSGEFAIEQTAVGVVGRFAGTGRYLMSRSTR